MTCRSLRWLSIGLIAAALPVCGGKPLEGTPDHDDASSPDASDGADDDDDDDDDDDGDDQGSDAEGSSAPGEGSTSNSTVVTPSTSEAIDTTMGEPDLETSDLPDEVRGPTPPRDGANFPFPQNRGTPNCTLVTTYRNDEVVAAYQKWRADTVTSDGAGGHMRIKRTPSDGNLELESTVSEGIAYGMLIAVYFNDQELFDELWLYEQLYLTEFGLMHWYISATGEVLGTGAASDADEDMAWALIMADRQWGGGGRLGDSYLNIAREQIQRMWDHEVLDGKMFLPGDSWGGWSDANPSYFAPSYYRTFAQVSGNAGWNDVVATSYDIIEKSLNETNGNAENGLVPAWCTSEGEPNSGVWQDNSAPTHYQYDSCRTPFRVGIDYCFHGEPRALAYVSKTTSFFSGIGVPNIVDGYDLDGTPRPQFPGGQSAAFVGPAGVGGMYDAAHSAFLQDAYDAVAGLDLLTGGAYYDESWTVISMLMMTGNFLDYTQIEPAIE